MQLVSIQEAAPQLGVGPRRVRALIKQGRLPARKIGSQWVVELDGVPARPPGRPIAARNAWALLAIASGDRPEWVGPSERSRLKRYLRAHERLAERLNAGEPRAIIHRLRALPKDIDRISGSFPVVRSGLSAKGANLDIVDVVERLDVYGSARSFAELQRALRPIEDPVEPNLLFRVPSHPWILAGRSEAPAIVAASDLLRDGDPRVARAAQELLKRSAVEWRERS
jgi:excisionase family DNA binding protein